MRNTIIEHVRQYYYTGVSYLDFYAQASMLKLYSDEEIKRFFEEKNELAYMLEDFIMECLGNKTMKRYFTKEIMNKLTMYSRFYKNEDLLSLLCDYYNETNMLGDYFLNLGIDCGSIEYYDSIKKLYESVKEIKRLVKEIDINLIDEDIRPIIADVKYYFSKELENQKNKCFDLYSKDITNGFEKSDYKLVDSSLCKYLEDILNYDLILTEEGLYYLNNLIDCIEYITMPVKDEIKLTKSLASYIVTYNYINTEVEENDYIK